MTFQLCFLFNLCKPFWRHRKWKVEVVLILDCGTISYNYWSLYHLVFDPLTHRAIHSFIWPQAICNVQCSSLISIKSGGRESGQHLWGRINVGMCFPYADMQLTSSWDSSANSWIPSPFSHYFLAGNCHLLFTKHYSLFVECLQIVV